MRSFVTFSMMVVSFIAFIGTVWCAGIYGTYKLFILGNLCIPVSQVATFIVILVAGICLLCVLLLVIKLMAYAWDALDVVMDSLEERGY